MTFAEYFNSKLLRILSETEQPISVEEYPVLLKTAEIEWEQIEKERLERRIAEYTRLSETLLDVAVELVECANSQDLDDCQEPLRQVAILAIEQLCPQHRESIMDSFGVRRTRSANGAGLDYKTAERKSEEDIDVLKGSSSLYGVFERQRNSSADLGDYAGKICLMTRHGWRPIVVRSGVEGLLRDMGIWHRYEDEFPMTKKRVPFEVEDRDRFIADWERLEDGTRVLTKMKDTKTGQTVWPNES